VHNGENNLSKVKRIILHQPNARVSMQRWLVRPRTRAPLTGSRYAELYFGLQTINSVFFCKNDKHVLNLHGAALVFHSRAFALHSSARLGQN